MSHSFFNPHPRFRIGIWMLLFAMIIGFVAVFDFNHYSVLTHAQDTDFDFETEYHKGIELMRRRQYEEALKSFKHANDIRGKTSPEAMLGMAQAYYGLNAHKNVIETCEKVLELVQDGEFRAQAFNFKGLALQAQAELKDEKKLAAAEESFRSGLALTKQQPVLQYNLGVVLLQQKRDPEGVAELRKFLALKSGDVYVEPATRMIENPRRAREAYAPDFSIVTAEGEHITLEDLKGKVVVLDFWGTWCPPCVASVPSLRALHKKFSKEPQFVLIGVSSDSEEATWREFTTKEKMIWPQYWDRDRKIQRAFNVHAFPTYIVIDHEGVVKYRSVGMSWERASYLNDAIKKLVKIVAKTDAAN